MKVGLISILMIGILGLSFNAHADFIQVSSPSFGAGSLTFDSNQNLYWLTPNATVGRSYNQVSDMLATDAQFSGFRYATAAELTNLYFNFGIPDINVYGIGINGTTTNVPGATILQSFLGVTYTGGTSLLETAGFVGSPFVSQVNGFTSVYMGDVAIRTDVPTNNGPTTFAYVATTLSSATVGNEYVGVGSWLVSSSVPVPSSWELMALGIFMLLVLSRQKLAR